MIASSAKFLRDLVIRGTDLLVINLTKARPAQAVLDPCLFPMPFSPFFLANHPYILRCSVFVICASDLPLTILVLRIHIAYFESFLSLEN